MLLVGIRRRVKDAVGRIRNGNIDKLEIPWIY